MTKIPVVCLCDTYDLKTFFGTGFQEETPDLELLRPDEVSDPLAIKYAFALWPGPDAFKRFPNVEMLCTPGAGVDGLIDHPELGDRAVVRLINPEQARMMSGYAAYHVVGWHRDLWKYQQAQIDQEWVHLDLTPPSQVPIGVLGFGVMGRIIAEGIAGLGYPVTAWATRTRDHRSVRVVAGDDGLEEILSNSRAIINVLPLTPMTTNIFDATRLGMMRPDAMLLQIGRGGHLDHDALRAALDAGRPGLAVLDVTVPEPVPKGHWLWTHPKIRITPHIASLSTPAAIARHVANSIEIFEAGNMPAAAVDRERGY